MARYKHYFRTSIQRHFPHRANQLMAEIDDQYRVIEPDVRFAATSDNPIDKRLDFCAYFLALIKVLDAQDETFDTTRKICLEVVTEYVRPKNKVQQLAKRLPAKLINTWLAIPLLSLFARKVGRNKNPDGFIATILTDKQETFGFGYGIDILECGICKLFTKHNLQHYASILCEVDEITSTLAGLKLIRTGTIATGAKKCDFRFVKESQIK